jgi:hypothetical protein
MSEQLISILYYNVIDICHINKYSHDDIINCITNIVRKLSNDQKKILIFLYYVMEIIE